MTLINNNLALQYPVKRRPEFVLEKVNMDTVKKMLSLIFIENYHPTHKIKRTGTYVISKRIF